ncbi:hypothetical protein UVI_02023570 [Ustilaginoidea virens]|nr:hypothetical protein UVI_02023570 [Ustilaginoidea virens]
MYAQDTASHRDPSRQPMLVGFNGMGDGYRRQLGPDGEEAGDLIGPLGHMEELPPYTRYPQEAFADKPTTEPIDHLTVSTVTDRNSTAAPGADRISPTDPIPGAGGIGLATRNPEFSSTEDLASLPLRASSIRSATSDGSQHDINGAARDFAEKPTQSKWQRRARKRLCGIVPYWVICLLLSGIVILGVVMGTVIGTMVTRHSGSPTPSDRSFAKPPVTNSVEFLASKPPDLPALATGCYALPPLEKYQVPKACIKDSSQTPAWSCDMPFRWYSMNVSNQDNQPDFSNYALKLAPFDARVSKFIWGSQPPEIPEFKTLRLVKDMEEANRGPAWYLEVDYNKTVMVREGQLKPASTGASKRNWEALSSPVPGFDKSRYLRKGFAAADGDKPWICTWPRIKLQVFIYPNQTFTPPRTSSASGSVATGSPSSTDGPSPPRKEPYPKLVKFVERRPDGLAASAPATCTQYQIVNNGQDKVPILDDNGRPVVIKISEVGQSSKDAVTRRQVNPGAGLLSSLQDRDVELTPCGCVSFSWSV